jgi:hypothetical protein
MSCYFYSLEKCFVNTVGFRLCYNSYKYTLDQDFNQNRIRLCGSSQLLDLWPEQIFIVLSQLMAESEIKKFVVGSLPMRTFEDR